MFYSCSLFNLEFRFPYKKYTKIPMANQPNDNNCASLLKLIIK